MKTCTASIATPTAKEWSTARSRVFRSAPVPYAYQVSRVNTKKAATWCSLSPKPPGVSGAGTGGVTARRNSAAVYTINITRRLIASILSSSGQITPLDTVCSAGGHLYRRGSGRKRTPEKQGERGDDHCSAKRVNRMKIGVTQIVLGDWPLSEVRSLCTEAGYQAVELFFREGGDPDIELPEDEIRRIGQEFSS